MAVIHSFFDESGKFHDQKWVAFRGFVASQSQLQEFDKQWNYQLRRTGMDALHWVDARRNGKALSSKIGPQSLEERLKELQPFADCVNDYLGLGVACVFEVTGWTSFAQDSKKLLGGSDNPFYVQFTRNMQLLVEYAKPDEYLSITCDEDEETSWNCYRLFRRVKELDPRLAKKLVALTFADDMYFPALQAADMLSFLCREQANLQFTGQDYDYREFFRYLTDERGSSSLEWRVAFKSKNDLKKLEDRLVRKNEKKSPPGASRRRRLTRP